MGEAHYGIEGAFFGYYPVGMLEGFVEVGAWEGWRAGVVVVEGAFDDAFEF